MFCGSILGCLIAFMRLSKFKPLEKFASIYITVIRGTPMLVQLYIVYYQLDFISYPTGTLFGVDLERALPCIIALSINSSAYVAEIIRAGIQAVDKGQMEGARSCGMTNAQAMRCVVMPQAVKNILPAIGNEFVTMVKETSIIQYLGIGDLMYNNGIVVTSTYNPLPCYYISAIIYLALNIILGKGLNLLEQPTAGKICFEGEDITAKGFDVNKHRQKVGMVFQQFNLFNNLTVLENITISLTKVKKQSEEESKEKALKLLKRVGLEDKANAYPSQLSGGQKQRIAIVRALAMSRPPCSTPRWSGRCCRSSPTSPATASRWSSSRTRWALPERSARACSSWTADRSPSRARPRRSSSTRRTREPKSSYPKSSTSFNKQKIKFTI